MLSLEACEDVIALCRKFKESLKDATSVYRNLPVLLDDEHKAISQHDLKAVEIIVREKLKIGQALEAKVNELMDQILAAKRIAEVFEIETEKFDFKLSGGLALFRRFLDVVKVVDEFKSRILEKTIEECSKNLNEFLTTYQSSKTSVEINKRVSAEMLRHYQESIRFWQNLASESESTYNAAGVRKTDSNHGVIKVGA